MIYTCQFRMNIDININIYVYNNADDADYSKLTSPCREVLLWHSYSVNYLSTPSLNRSGLYIRLYSCTSACTVVITLVSHRIHIITRIRYCMNVIIL